jgi:hypothetical protein
MWSPPRLSDVLPAGLEAAKPFRFLRWSRAELSGKQENETFHILRETAPLGLGIEH